MQINAKNLSQQYCTPPHFIAGFQFKRELKTLKQPVDAKHTSKEWTYGRPRLDHAFSHVLTESNLKIENGNPTEHQTDHIWNEERRWKLNSILNN